MSTATSSRAARQEETRSALVDAADRVFVANGYHASSLDQIAKEAGFTKGAVYANFASKEDLFFAVYERRSARFCAETEAAVEKHGPAATLHRLARETTSRRGRDDGWLAVFFEFWAHVLRNPELRERFAELRARSRRPLEEAFVAARGATAAGTPRDTTAAVVAMYALQVGLALEHMTDPALVPATLGEQISRAALDLDFSLLEGRK